MFNLIKKFSQERFYQLGLLALCSAPMVSVVFPRALIFIPLFFVLTATISTPWHKLKTDKNFKIFFAILALLLIFFMGHSLLISEQEESIKRLIKLGVILPVGGLFLFSLQQLRLNNSLKFLDGLFISCALSSLFLIAELVFNYPVYYMSHEIPAGWSFSTAVYNRGAVTIVFLFLTAFFLQEKKCRYLTFTCMVPVIIMLFMVQSQTAQLIFFFALVFYYAFPWRYKFSWIMSWLAFSLFMASLPFVVTKVFMNLPSFIDDVYFFKEGYVGPRLEIWDYISKKIMESPWIGHGLEFTKTYDNFDNTGRYTNDTSVLHPHSFILQIWIELGAIGVLIATALFSYALRKIYTIEGTNIRKVVFTLFVSFLVVSSFSHGMWQSWWIGLMFICAGCVVLANSNKSIKLNNV